MYNIFETQCTVCTRKTTILLKENKIPVTPFICSMCRINKRDHTSITPPYNYIEGGLVWNHDHDNTREVDLFCGINENYKKKEIMYLKWMRMNWEVLLFGEPLDRLKDGDGFRLIPVDPDLTNDGLGQNLGGIS